MSSRVLVTGGSGFIGRHVLPFLVRRGFEVHAVGRRTPASAPQGVVWHRADLHEVAEQVALLDSVRPTHLLHLAWYTEHGQFWSAPENMRWLSSSLQLVQLFKDAGGHRLVVAGTCAEYDGRYGFCSEHLTPLRPNTLYGTAKDSLRRLLTLWAPSMGLSWAWGRVFLLFGTGEDHRRLIPSVMQSLHRGEHTRCSSGRQIRDFSHVGDVAAGFAALLDSCVEGPVNIASGEPRTIRSVVETMAKLIGRPDLARFGDIADRDESPMLVADVRRLRDEVGFRPRFGLDDHLREILVERNSEPG